ncbi:hypothetical protein L1987_44015 [Smallanthus sonchifolius]|uniref:Uncharacterized protein n=1 Tax=Smallanthus sonchifolius TaxID=185202 RepID=A0ACB9GND7_9ASTR|nr:hypothetical protein L1987_44015 [Smallanthus sonchifolius]
MDQTSPKSPPTTPRLNSQAPTAAPTPLIVPKAFKYPEMYMSPTDSIMSPVSKGLLARTRSKKSSRQLRNSATSTEQHNKIRDSKFGDVDALEI